ncbi:hypothetical protein Poli38472_007861 [Pythium oligandrum]|uniref:Uncharacterized protein n=1 Tax=Pythium oligandrum TaxID=41045 RepID=A0A8K1FPA9_PYTOL|nr:hypothetical protein Poli38472_007861 [Pythium oligandrum]|eukprot:TMW68189.1 hypothetical protein Poli38472_007861 [Pythium oligandrum]
MLKCADSVRSPRLVNESNVVPKVIAVRQARGKNKGVRLSHADEQIVVRHALEILNAAEVILLVEYLEIATPTVCCCFMIIAAQFDSARYNPRISVFYHNSQQSLAAVENLGLYIVLQCLSIVAMNWVMWRRYGLSASTFLSYVLECHAASIQGKMIGWFAVLLYFPVLHYGADFKFKFEFAPIDP